MLQLGSDSFPTGSQRGPREVVTGLAKHYETQERAYVTSMEVISGDGSSSTKARSTLKISIGRICLKVIESP